jgi:fibronectin-binding autotransporter adhesin
LKLREIINKQKPKMKIKKSILSCALVVGMIQVIGLGAASAQVAATWTGATNGDWNSTTWTIGANTTATPVSGDTLVFNSTGNETLINGLSTSDSFAGIDFTVGNHNGGAFTFNGDTFSLTQGISDYTNNGMTLGETGTISLSNSLSFTVEGAGGGSGTRGVATNAGTVLADTSNANQTTNFFTNSQQDLFNFAGGYVLNTGTNSVNDTFNLDGPGFVRVAGFTSGGVLTNSLTVQNTYGGLLEVSALSNYTGGTTILSGFAGINNAAGTFGTGTITIGANGSAVGSGALGFATFAGSGTTIANAFNVLGNGTKVIENDTGSAYTYSGGITLGNGAGAPSNLNFFTAESGGGAQMTESGAITGNGNIIFNSASTTGNSGGQVVLSGSVNNAGTISNLGGVAGANGNVISGAIGGNVTGILQNSADTLKIENANTAYTGTTTINGGTLDLGGGTTAGGLGSSTPLVLGGGVLVYTTTGTNAQTFSGTTINAGASAVGSTIGGDTINLGALTRNVGGTVNLASNGTTTTTSGTSGSILTDAKGSAYATFGTTDWAVNNGGTIDSLSDIGGYTTNTATTLSGNADIASQTGNGNTVLAANTSITSLRFNAATSSNNNNVTATGFTLTTGGILIGAGSTSATSITGGTLEGAAGDDLVVINDSASTLTISSTIADNTSATGLTFGGTGAVNLTGTNTYTGQTTIGSGTVTLSGGNLGTGALVLSNDATAALNLNGTSTTVASLAGGGMLGGNITNTTSGSTTSSIVLTVGSSASTTTYAGVISNGTFTGGAGGANTVGLTLTGGTLILTGANTYTGTTTINTGATLQVGDGTTIASNNTGAAGGFGANAAISNGTGVQGGATAGSLASTSIVDKGSLVYNEFDIQAPGITAAGDLQQQYLGELVGATISGGGSVTLLGGGGLALSGANTFSGGLNIKAGTVYITNAAGSAGSGTITIGDSNNTGAAATLAAIFSGTLNAANAINVVGTGADTISFVINNNDLSASSATFSGAVTLGSGGTASNLTVQNNFATVESGATSLVLSGNISGNGNLILQTNIGAANNSANVVLSGASTGVNNVGTITNNGAGTIIVGSGNINTTIGDAIGTNVTGVIENSQYSNLILTGANAFTSQISVQQGTLAVEGGSLSGSNAVVLGNSTGNTSGIFQLGTGSTANNETVASLTTSGNGTGISTGVSTGNAVVGGASVVSTLTVSPSGTDTFGGTLGGAGTSQNNLGLTMAGSGTLALTGANTYAGPTTISSGVLFANNAISSTGTGAVSVNSGTLGGTGTIAPTGVTSGTAVNIAAGAFLSPSNGGANGAPTFSTLTFALSGTSTVNLATGAKFVFDLGAVGSPGATSDFVDVTSGTLTLNSQNVTDFTFNQEAGFGVGTYTLIQTAAEGDLLGSLGSTLSETQNGFTETLSEDPAQSLILTVTTSAVPEPSTWALMFLGLAGLAGWRHRRFCGIRA